MVSLISFLYQSAIRIKTTFWLMSTVDEVSRLSDWCRRDGNQCWANSLVRFNEKYRRWWPDIINVLLVQFLTTIADTHQVSKRERERKLNITLNLCGSESKRTELINNFLFFFFFPSLISFICTRLSVFIY
jgi:hypothetical protein